MTILIDTHTFLWFVNDDPLLSPSARKILESDIDILLSIASIWEIAIKLNSGKLRIPEPFDKFIPQAILENDMKLLPISLDHLSLIATLPMHHRDPFDRLLIAQALTEKITLVSLDSVFDKYSVDRRW